MAHTSKFIATAAALMLLSSTSAFTQSGGAGGSASGGSASGGATGGAAGTNSAGTANSSGGRAPGGITAGASGTGQSVDGKPTTGNELVDKQDREVDRKVKNICKGC